MKKAVVIAMALLMISCSKHGLVSTDPAVDYLTARWIKDTPELPNETWAHNEVRKNITEDVKQWRHACYDPRKVYVTKTQDTGTYVIHISGPDQKGMSLWLDQDGSVNSISY